MKTKLLTLTFSGFLFLNAPAQIITIQNNVSTSCQRTPWQNPRPAHHQSLRNNLNTYPYYYQAYIPPGMPTELFSRAMMSIAAQGFDANRLQIARQVLASNMLTSTQVADIMQLFSFESTRLEFAKNAYYRVIDPQNYFVVNNVFHFSSSINELYRYIM